MEFSDAYLEELARRNDIVDVVSSYVNLTKRSGANLFGLCPFHSEKTPSFSVAPDKQIYHCFGCGKGGGVISFIMEIEGLSFPEAVEFLARRANMPLPEERSGGEGSRRKRLLELNRDAVADAIRNARYNKAQNARFYCADASDWMAEMAARGEKADLVFMDPPRQGSSPKFLNSLLALAPERVVYISCGPESLARDLGILTRGGYRVREIWPVDMFPHTEHVECVVLLTKAHK